MSPSKKSSTHATHTKSQSHAAVAEPETTSSPPAAPATPAPPSALTALVTGAIQALDSLESSLDLNIVVRQNDKAQMHAMNRVSFAALTLASDIVTSDPVHFPDFSGLKDSATYVQTMTPLAKRLHDFAGHLDNSILNQQAPAAQQTLVIYSMVKELARMDINQSMRDKIVELKAEIVPKRKDPKPKQTVGQRSAKVSAKRLADRIAKAKEFLASVDPSTSLASPTTAAPAASPVDAAAPKAATPPSPATPTTSAPAPVTQAAN